MRRIAFLAIPPLIILVMVTLYVTVSGKRSAQRQREREQLALRAGPGDPIQVAVVWPDVEPMGGFLHGLRMAAAELNDQGGINGRKLHLAYHEERPGIAKTIARDLRTVAAIGYSSSDTAMKDVVTYNEEGIVLILPFASDPLLTLRNFSYTFRTIPNDRAIAEMAGQNALTAGFYSAALTNSTNREISVVIAGARTEYGVEFARNFRKNSASWRLITTNRNVAITNTLTLRVARSHTYDEKVTNFLPVIDEILKSKFDLILVADVLPRAGYLIRQLRQMGVESPILTGSGLDSHALWNIASNKAFGVLFPSKWVWPPHLSSLPTGALAPQFVTRYRSVHSGIPGLHAAQGYEALHILGQAISRAGGTSPQLIAATLSHTDNWRGMMEIYPHFKNGNLAISNIFIKMLMSIDYPSNAQGRLREFVIRDLRAHPYTNIWFFGGFLSPLVTNRLVEIEEHVGPEVVETNQFIEIYE